jgi:hypothetical protein
MNIFNFFKRKSQEKTITSKDDLAFCDNKLETHTTQHNATPQMVEKQDSLNAEGWKLYFINETQQDPEWNTKIDDERRKQLIFDTIKQNEYSASNWKVTIADKAPFFGDGVYGAKSGAVFPINLRCICFQHGDNIYDVEYVCIDLKSGKPYLSVEKTCGGPGGSFITTYQQKTLSWNSFAQYTAHISDELRDYYTGISESNWQDYLNPKYVYFKL